MARKRLTFTVEGETYREIAERLDADESVDDWVRDAIDERLADDSTDGRNPDAKDCQDDYDEPEPLEFVDDCAI